MAKRRIDVHDGQASIRAVQAGSDARDDVATAVRYLLEELTERAPGNSVEVRVPPYGVTQCVQGPRHTRGTPPNVIEMTASTWIALAVGTVTWEESLDTGQVLASGSRASLAGLLPLMKAEKIEE